jgi:GTP cyclohydrolase II
MSGAREIARAVDALRRGWPVAIEGRLVLAVETCDEAALAAFDSGGPADLLISGNRAETLKLANQREGVPTGPVLVARTSWIDMPTAFAMADPALDLATPLKGPFRTLPLDAPAVAEAAVRLARLAGLLPALFVGGTGDPAAVLTSQEILDSELGAMDLVIASRAKLPTKAAEHSEIVAFRARGDAAEHVALLIGTPTGEPPLVRVHSECLTGDALGSLKCDCGPQLNDALAAIAAAGWGILIYLRQEGRGIGLVNKLRAYALQDQGFDTVDANHRLGFADDERSFLVAGRMLQLLGQEEVKLLTNNPRKVAALEAAGIRVIERVALKTGSNPHNKDYLDTKKHRSGHQL